MITRLGQIACWSLLGASIIVAPGCSGKWLQSGSEKDEQVASQESERARVGGSESSSQSDPGHQSEESVSGINPNFPDTSATHDGHARAELNGFEQLAPGQTPSEEYLAHGGTVASVSPSEGAMRRRAELTREEQAAAAAGLVDVFFGYDRWNLSEQGMEALSGNAKWLKEHPGAVLRIEGHCDERGTVDYNMILGDKRAKAARAYLLEAGVSPKQVQIVSYGKERPFCFERDEGCYQQNRRGHMLLTNKK